MQTSLFEAKGGGFCDEGRGACAANSHLFITSVIIIVLFWFLLSGVFIGRIF